ncbi:hypothetical protein, partial [Mesorhizobium sp. M1D.F.Ca.ET.184.01.1.1]|uniref:hypothetical protein n=1 Tax=Mesorhizobium sp. M1D.F.Ca.ET.184.01.1.1 TaxID=2563931 RepID=UPI001AEF1DD6
RSFHFCCSLSGPPHHPSFGTSQGLEHGFGHAPSFWEIAILKVPASARGRAPIAVRIDIGRFCDGLL